MPSRKTAHVRKECDKAAGLHNSFIGRHVFYPVKICAVKWRTAIWTGFIENGKLPIDVVTNAGGMYIFGTAGTGILVPRRSDNI